MDTQFDRFSIVYLKPAELFIARKPAIVTTILGSCISVTLFHQRLGLAAICHAFLPQCKKQTACTFCHSERYRYVTCVIPEMIQKIAGHSINATEIEVQLFGGAEIIASQNMNPSVGMQNVDWAMKMIKTEGLRLKNADVGGLAGRKIFFNTSTGQVFMRRIHYPIDNGNNLKTSQLHKGFK